MNNIHEKDWADDSWCGHTGMDNFSDYCVVEKKENNVVIDKPDSATEEKSSSEKE